MVASIETEEQEALRVLTGLARGRFGRIAPERIARHILQVTPDADWPVRRAALEALTRRYGFAKRDELRVAKGGPRAEVLGVYTTARKADAGRAKARPYATALLALEALCTRR